MKFKEKLPKNSKLTRMMDDNWEEFRKYCLHSGVIISDFNWEITEPYYYKPMPADSIGIHREQIILIDGLLATIRMRNGEVIGTGLKIVDYRNIEDVERVLKTGEIIYFGIADI